MGVEAYEGEIVMSMDDGRTVAWEDDPAPPATPCAQPSATL